ncbi:glycosyltransferase [soil metagenome]
MPEGAHLGPMLAGFVLSFVLCLGLVATQRWHGRFSHDGLLGLQKFHKRKVPRIGGAGIWLAYWLVWPLLGDEGLRALWAQIGVAALPVILAGIAEDLTKRVGTRARLLASMAAGAVFVAMTGYAMVEVDLPGVDWLLSFSIGGLVFTAFAMGGVANAVNIIDGFNGLAAGTCLVICASFAWVAAQVGDRLVVELALIYMGLIGGFFVLNFPFGRIFLGDGGAYFLGFLLASLGVLLPMRNPEISAWAAILICGYPVIETLASMRRKARRDGYSMGVPDRVHFHMLVHRRLARRVVPAVLPAEFRNPATSVVTWLLPATTAALAAISYDSALLSAMFFFLTVYLYMQAYGVMSLNRQRMPPGLARLF